MAINFLALPALQSPGGYNFEPLGKGFDAIREGRKDNRLLDIKQQGQDLDRSKFGLQERQFGAQEQQRKVEMLGNQAMAVLNLEGPAREAAHARLLSQHPNAASLSPEYRDPRTGPQLIAADWGKFRDQLAEKEKNARIGLMHAQTEKERAHGRAYDELGKARAGTGMVNPPVDPTEGMGIDRQNNMVPIRTGDQYLNSGSSGGDGVSLEHSRDGRIGQRSSSIPGVVVDDRGRVDKLGTIAAQGQRALDMEPDSEKRARLVEFRNTQQMGLALHGRPPRAGHMYDKQGREVPIGPLSSSADTQERKDRAITKMSSQIDDAEETILGSWNVTRSLAKGLDDLGTAGRFVQPQNMERINSAYGQYKEGVLQTVYALSGKQSTNKEMEAFLELYMPRPGEGDERIAEKTSRLRGMLSTLKTNTKKGMIYEDAEREAIAGPSIDRKPRQNSPQDKPSQNPTQDRIKNKYGLE